MKQIFKIEICIQFVYVFYYRIVGFEELGGSDNFPTSVLEKRLGSSGNLNIFDVENVFVSTFPLKL